MIWYSTAENAEQSTTLCSGNSSILATFQQYTITASTAGLNFDRSKSYQPSAVSNNENNNSTTETWFRYDKQSVTLSLVQNGTSLSSSSRHVKWSESDNRDLPTGKVIAGQILWTKKTQHINYNVHFDIVWQDLGYCCDGRAVMYDLFALLIMVWVCVCVHSVTSDATSVVTVLKIW